LKTQRAKSRQNSVGEQAEGLVLPDHKALYKAVIMRTPQNAAGMNK
jgi:DNA-binding FadR family transcriptional regulator